MALAMEWVSRITTISLEMVLPGIAGQWLDQKWGTSFLALAGFALGLTIGIWHLLAISKESQRKSLKSEERSEADQLGPKSEEFPKRSPGSRGRGGESR